MWQFFKSIPWSLSGLNGAANIKGDTEGGGPSQKLQPWLITQEHLK